MPWLFKSGDTSPSEEQDLASSYTARAVSVGKFNRMQASCNSCGDSPTPQTRPPQYVVEVRSTVGSACTTKQRDNAVANEMVRQLLKSIHVSSSFCSVSNLDKCTRCSARAEGQRRNMRIVCTNHCCVAVDSQQHRKTQRKGR